MPARAAVVGETVYSPGAWRGTAADFALDLLSMRRVQLLGAFCLTVLLPAVIRWQVDPLSLIPPLDGTIYNTTLSNALIGTTAALVLGYVAMRQMRAHPGVTSLGYVFYSFALSYGLLGLAFLFVRADYSRYQILSSCALTILWFLVIDYVTRKRAVWRLAFLPGTSANALPRAPRVLWRAATDPSQSVQGLGGVVADLRHTLSADWERFLASCALKGVPIYDIREVTEWLTGKVKVEHLSENTLSSGLSRILYGRIKRLVDLTLVILAAPFVLPLIAFTALIIRLESPGPAIFTQLRMGHRGRAFTIYKLRSMRNDRTESGRDYTSSNDPRVTRVGAFIRKYRIDELPQIWNILKGEMGWIGPRPEAVSLADWYEREVPFYCYRHIVRPGITGWAQVHQGNVARPDAASEKLQYDFYYIKNLSPWLDLLIAAKSLQTILTGFGAR
jgi:lipopolysaccharide/colanic/teichoic acid biosynthesis glycosyltransferase